VQPSGTARDATRYCRLTADLTKRGQRTSRQFPPIIGFFTKIRPVSTTKLASYDQLNMDDSNETARFASEVDCLEQLTRRISDEFATSFETIQLGSQTLQVLKVADPSAVFDDLVEQAHLAGTDQLLWEPYWAEAWESAIGVGQRLITLDLIDRSVLDLGCGIGTAGAVAAKCGARVVMADNAPPALLFARLNSWPWRERVDVSLCDWQRDSLPARPFDLIVGADIIYERQQWGFLNAFWRSHLGQGGSVLLGEPGRLPRGAFQEWAGNHGWSVQLDHETVVGRERPIRVFSLSIREE
jgi:predicted nicotinamide N-methyase